jgi:hypothetical protein
MRGGGWKWAFYELGYQQMAPALIIKQIKKDVILSKALRAQSQ